MKKTLLVLPLAILLANCSSSRNANSSANSGMNTSASTAGTAMNAGTSASESMASTGSETSGSGSMSASASGSMSTPGSGSMNTNSTSANLNNKSTSATTFSASTNWDVYDPNNYMQNPEKYLRPSDLGKTGGWTYNKDWRRNTNFTPEAVGQWQLVLTPDVAANWIPDTRRPETYASFWTPEAVMGRYQASMAAAARTRDSIAALNALVNANTSASRKKGGKRTSLASVSSESSWASGSGTTGTMGTGGTSSMNADVSTNTTANMDNAAGTMNNNVTIPFALTAVNGNNFMLPTLNLHIDNGSFTAYTGCNNAVGTIVVNGSSLRFEEAAPSSNVECIGGFDQSAFLDRLRRADSYEVVNNEFRLKQGDQVLMVFAKNNL